MFGMLDYRAHKLLWLILLPLRIIWRIAFFIVAGISVLIAQQTSYSFIVKVVIGYVAFEAILLLLQGIFAIISWLIQRAFFWTVDIIPSEGRNMQEAREVVLRGKIVSLLLKLNTDIQNWSWDDTQALVGLSTRRARWFFHAKERFTKRVAILQEYYEETGRQPQNLNPEEVKKLVGDLDFIWIEHLMTERWFFNAALGFILIVCGLIAANPY
jgi:hypothetical protein